MFSRSDEKEFDDLKWEIKWNKLFSPLWCNIFFIPFSSLLFIISTVFYVSTRIFNGKYTLFINDTLVSMKKKQLYGPTTHNSHYTSTRSISECEHTDIKISFIFFPWTLFPFLILRSTLEISPESVAEPRLLIRLYSPVQASIALPILV